MKRRSPPSARYRGHRAYGRMVRHVAAARPSLEYLKKLAKDRLPTLRRANPAAKLRRRPARGARASTASRAGAPLRASTSRRWKPHPNPSPPACRRDDPDILRRHPARGRGRGSRQAGVRPARLAQAADADGSTALLQAAEWNQPAMVALFLARGADPQRPYAHSAHTPLSWALTVERLDAARGSRPRRRGSRSLLRGGHGRGHHGVRAFFDAEGRLRPGASRTGSSPLCRGRLTPSVSAGHRPRSHI